MQYALAILAAVALVKASPFPQAVTGAISPTGSAPSGCKPTLSGSFGIAVMNVSTSAMPKRQVSQRTEYVSSEISTSYRNFTDRSTSSGQPLAASVTAKPVSQKSDGQPNAMSMVTAAPVSQKSDGQPNATPIMMAPVSMITDGQFLRLSNKGSLL